MTDKNQVVCDVCRLDLIYLGHTYSNDVWIMTTTYDDDGEPIKTQDPTSDQVKRDYLVICPDCEGLLFKSWNELVTKLVRQREHT